MFPLWRKNFVQNAGISGARSLDPTVTKHRESGVLLGRLLDWRDANPIAVGSDLSGLRLSRFSLTLRGTVRDSSSNAAARLPPHTTFDFCDYLGSFIQAREKRVPRVECLSRDCAPRRLVVGNATPSLAW